MKSLTEMDEVLVNYTTDLHKIKELLLSDPELYCVIMKEDFKALEEKVLNDLS